LVDKEVVEKGCVVVGFRLKWRRGDKVRRRGRDENEVEARVKVKVGR